MYLDISIYKNDWGNFVLANSCLYWRYVSENKMMISMNDPEKA